MFDILLTQEEKKLQAEVKRFVKERVPSSLVRAMDADEVRYPKAYMESLAAQNLLGLRFSKEWGGRGHRWTGEVTAIEEIGVLGSGMSCLYSLVSIVGEALHHFGTPEQKEKYLKPTLGGKLCCAEALTEPRGGSDFFGATTLAKRDGEHYLLNGQKRFVVGAEGADYFLVYAKTAPEAEPHKSLSCFIVEREMGVEVKHVYGLLGSRGGGTGRLYFRDTKVPAKNLVGPANGAALVFNRMMIPERLTTAAGALGMARCCLEIAVRYSNRRKAFGETLRRFQAVSFKVADAIAKLDAARGLVYVAARHVDEGLDSRRLVSEAKKISTEMLWEVVNYSMQIMGGIGYTNVYPIERFFRDARLQMIWTGTNEVMSLLIQHEFYKEVLEKIGESRDVEGDAGDLEGEEEKVYE
ncbi:MAG: acyl-CoA dehydrogenase [Deltaproteobacteria bacterium RBG_16_49_23]|nr:MAG: acyl-CoA dehydrogenase [Deltaproteobacteria bacterium RBG_16_49_23]